ncbi:MAG TPA: hypothetical protein DEG17_26740 [Cyanobacteria bacterium UBA11149]|nr:hypothetical protein [Cyanobacteria bacterium UBA11367]HBE60929.1 hypothetical protein [Cyanobacteria bacterium UBA11366]HBK62430.1 hypothetical protein [Cyanobacteria bacterium UBA11166]HBR76391.1 hypothetical protein [Cyanobacteria bacterium UBA11159]HBS72046.1 hypothetical protein [Cyanobacteria bacterium UBA11153]HBW92367.1 hypothetical protein [Cyanobacteria bacterium UBA11149]HCA95460.1 hypothetical protein [Cyanobacteria bacterium UBA9226]
MKQEIATPDFSLYQLALENLSIDRAALVSPLLLKSLVGTILDIAIAQKISGTICAKLPPGGSWISEINRYRKQDWFTERIYLCGGEEEIEVTDRSGAETDDDTEARIIPLQIGGGNLLKPELFLIVISDEFSSLIAARPLTQIKSDTGREGNDSLGVIWTFNRRVINLVMGKLKEAIGDDLEKKLWEELANIDDKRIEASVDEDREINLLNQLLVKQLERTETILHPPAKIKVPSPKDNLRNQDELLKRVAQELKTPLTNMKTALSLLDSSQLKPVQRQRYMQLLHTECDRQNSLIAGLLDLVQIDEDLYDTVMPGVELAEIIPGIVSTYQPLAQEKGIQLGYTIPSNLPPVSCLETWLRQITINLLNNSLKFTLTGGKVRVLASLQGEYIQLAFSDTGIGIAPSEITKLFDSFYRGRPIAGAETGAGLGLTIVQQLLLRCGGSISVNSQLRKGSTFKVLLPIASSGE